MEVLNLATSESFSGPSLPAPDSSGCAAFDSNSNYVYYVEGEDGVDDGAAVFRIAGELCGGGKGVEGGGLRACYLRGCGCSPHDTHLDCAAGGCREKGSCAWSCCADAFALAHAVDRLLFIALQRCPSQASQ